MTANDSVSKKEIKFSLRSKIILLILILIGLLMVILYSTILKDERKALTDLTISGGGSIAKTLAINAWNVFYPHLLDVKPDGNFDEASYEKLNYFDINFTESLDQLVQQKDIVYAVVLNKFGKIIGHSKSEKIIPENSPWDPLPGIKTYKELYNPGEPVNFIVQDYSGEYYDPKIMRYVTGDLVDISFPMLSSFKNVKDLSLYEGEVHIGISKDTIYNVLRNAEAKLQGVSLIAALIGLLGSILLAGIIISPILKLVQAMGRVAKGDIKQKVVVKTKDEVELLAVSFNRMTEGLSKYVSAGLVKRMMEHPEALTLGGSYKRLTMMESDIRNFTGTSEKMKPDEVVKYLNEYLDIMSKVIIKHGGEIDKYIGDAIVAHFGLFDPDDKNIPEHAKNAIYAAVAMNKALDEFNKKRAAEGLYPVRMGIGLNTGDVILGNMGSTERMDYTVIGDPMNLTARLCDNAGKDFFEPNGNVIHLKNILISETTYELVRDLVVVDNKVVSLKVKGKEKPVKVYQVLDVK